MGEGGEQILRSALGLSLLSGRPFQLSCIRADRDRAGLRPQHLAAVHAAAAISAARVTADRIGSEAITFEPGPVRAGDYFFDIGAAGATSLVFQTLLLPLARAAGSSRLTLRGGTHVPASPCYHYLDWHWRPLLAAIGVPFDLTLRMAGFYPKGGGEVQAVIPGSSMPRAPAPVERGTLRQVRGLPAVANLPREIAERQRDQTLRRLRGLLPDLEPAIVLEELPAVGRGTWRRIYTICSAPCARRHSPR